MRQSDLPRRARAAAHGPRLPRRGHSYPPALEWTEDVSGRCPRITALGSHSLLVENHTGILAFTESRIVLNSRARAGAVIIRGDIQRIELPCRGGDAPDEE